MADKTLQEPTTPRARGGPGPGRGGRGRGKPLPRVLKIQRLKAKHRYPTLNHPSPEGWWDLRILNCFPKKKKKKTLAQLEF